MRCFGLEVQKGVEKRLRVSRDGEQKGGLRVQYSDARQGVQTPSWTSKKDVASH